MASLFILIDDRLQNKLRYIFSGLSKIENSIFHVDVSNTQTNIVHMSILKENISSQELISRLEIVYNIEF